MCIIIIGQGFSAHKVAAVATYKNRCQKKKNKKEKKRGETHTRVMCTPGMESGFGIRGGDFIVSCMQWL